MPPSPYVPFVSASFDVEQIVAMVSAYDLVSLDFGVELHVPIVVEKRLVELDV